LQKQPIVIQDQESNGIDLIHEKFFKGSVKTNKFELNRGSDTDWQHNKYKYFVICLKQDCEVTLCPPTSRKVPTTDDHLIVLQCKKGNCLILPFNWRYLCNIEANCLGVHDLITYLMP